MTPEQFSKLLGQQQEELKRAFARTLPVKIGNEAVNFARDNFRKEGFMDGSLKPWTPSKRKSDPKHPDRAYATPVFRMQLLITMVPGTPEEVIG